MVKKKATKKSFEEKLFKTISDPIFNKYFDSAMLSAYKSKIKFDPFSDYLKILKEKSDKQKQKPLPQPPFIFAMPAYNDSGYDYIRIKDIPEEYKKEFCYWMRGQTAPCPEYPIKISWFKDKVRIAVAFIFERAKSITRKFERLSTLKWELVTLESNIIDRCNLYNKGTLIDAVYFSDFIRWYNSKIYRIPTLWD